MFLERKNGKRWKDKEKDEWNNRFTDTSLTGYKNFYKVPATLHEDVTWEWALNIIKTSNTWWGKSKQPLNLKFNL